MADGDLSQVKIKFILKQDKNGYPPIPGEQLCAIQRADGYEIKNIPWFAKGVAYGDLVAAKLDGEGELAFDRVLRRGGNSTLWLCLTESDEPQGEQIREAIKNAGATSDEMIAPWLIWMNVPPSALAAIRHYLIEGEKRGDWEFEVGYLAD